MQFNLQISFPGPSPRGAPQHNRPRDAKLDQFSYLDKVDSKDALQSLSMTS